MRGWRGRGDPSPCLTLVAALCRRCALIELAGDFVRIVDAVDPQQRRRDEPDQKRTQDDRDDLKRGEQNALSDLPVVDLAKPGEKKLKTAASPAFLIRSGSLLMFMLLLQLVSAASRSNGGCTPIIEADEQVSLSARFSPSARDPVAFAAPGSVCSDGSHSIGRWHRRR